jgi:hypothetical protein
MVPYRLKLLVERGKDRLETLALSLVTAKIPLPPDLAQRKVVLLGASVGHAWHLPVVFPNVKSFVEYEFDKTPLLDKVIPTRPDAIIIKECAAYFPSNEPQQGRQAMVHEWVDRIREAGIQPILATVVPVSRSHDEAYPGRSAALCAFNDWLRHFAAEEKVEILDLEKALRISASDRHLAPGLDSGDGLHLQRDTYRRRLDHLLPPVLMRTFS